MRPKFNYAPEGIVCKNHGPTESHAGVTVPSDLYSDNPTTIHMMSAEVRKALENPPKIMNVLEFLEEFTKIADKAERDRILRVLAAYNGDAYEA